MIEQRRKSFDGTPIFVTVWDDVSDPKAVVMISHGVSEYAGRYDDFARYLNSRGFIVFCDDHRAHGRTEPAEGHGRHKGDIFRDTVRDEVFFSKCLEEEYGLPVLFFGHSYGSMIGQAFAAERTGVKGIALVGSAHLGVEAFFGKFVVAPLALVAGKWRPKMVNVVTDKLFSYRGDSGRSQWLTRDPERRQDFIRDPLCGIDLSLAFHYSMIRGVSALYKRSVAERLDPSVPVALFSGEQDPIGGKGRKLLKLLRFYAKHGVTVEMKLYGGMRHEIINEIGRERPYEDIAEFFLACLGRKEA